VDPVVVMEKALENKERAIPKEKVELVGKMATRGT
jgi:hypothetical protein